MRSYIYADKFFDNNVYKRISIVGDDFSIGNDEIVEESIEINQPYNSSSDLVFGSVEAGVIKFQTINTHCAIGEDISVYLYFDDDDESPFLFGNYTITDNVMSDDRMFRTVTAKDVLYKAINTDVTEWYNSVFDGSTLTLRAFRNLFFEQLSIEQETVNLVNDLMPVRKTIDAQLSGKDILAAILEINGCIGRIGTDGKFVYSVPSSVSSYTLTPNKYIDVKYVDYNVQPIDKVQIRQEENDIGVIVGSGDNPYIVESNFLTYGLSENELETYANNLLGVISGISAYKPCEINMPAFPCIEVGDRFTVRLRNNTTFQTILMSRKITGLTQMYDLVKSTGNNKRQEKVNGIHSDIKMLRGKSNVLERSIDQTRSTITDVENNLQSQITQTEDRLQVQISSLQSQIDGEIMYYEGDVTPTLTNYPAYDFCRNIPCNNTVKVSDELGFVYTDEDYQLHLQDLYYDNVAVLSYRFSRENGVFLWRVIADGQTTAILQEIADLKVKSNRIESNVSAVTAELHEGYYTIVETDSKFSQTASQISAKVSQTGGYSSTFGWNLTSSKFELKSNSQTVFLCNSSGIEVSGKITAKSGFIGNGSAGFTINNTSISNGVTSMLDTSHNGIYLGTDGIVLGKGAFKVNSSGRVDAKDFHITGGDIVIQNASASISTVKVYDSTNTSELFAFGLVVTKGNEYTSVSSHGIDTPRTTANAVQTNSLRGVGTRDDVEVYSDLNLINGTGSSTTNRIKYSNVLQIEQSGTIALRASGSYVTVGDSGSYLGFFGKTYGKSKQNIYNVSSSASTTTLASKINELMGILRDYNLIGGS